MPAPQGGGVHDPRDFHRHRGTRHGRRPRQGARPHVSDRLDSEMNVADRYKVRALPSSFFIGRQAEVRVPGYPQDMWMLMDEEVAKPETYGLPKDRSASWPA